MDCLGPIFQFVLEQLQTLHDELEQVRSHGAPFRPEAHSSHTTGPVRLSGTSGGNPLPLSWLPEPLCPLCLPPNHSRRVTEVGSWRAPGPTLHRRHCEVYK
ncbi:hypothetical protein ATANTOWER_016806 [Ataeniobius toweri]|uniref:Uncharacterized protein n=1 Tax=Ataeniobius toweri TaxID=208326 RepID=A0ABU7C808_9TELE|nr:hypothetical protein [Ataeniobius toweri]